MAIDFKLLRPFLTKAANNPANPMVQEKAIAMSSNMDVEDAQQDEDIVDPHLQKREQHGDLGAPDQAEGGKDPQLESKLMQASMPELSMPDQNDNSTFGKLAAMLRRAKTGSAYVRDVAIGDLPAHVAADVTRFAGEGKRREVVEYGMVVSELLPKADAHNFKLAEKNVASDLEKKSRKAALEEFYAKKKEKCILLLNDRIIDGHHFLAKAKALGITCSIRVLDLTPVRFQEKRASSVIERLKAAKRKSDRKDYPGKYRILNELIRSHGQEFKVDQPKPDYPGVTHIPTGFRIHVTKDLARRIAVRK